ncbi:MAG: iron-sulfur cluster assembly scaffold protein [Actinobacteria bacterium]|nr:iron-sulfur cluster assembly scaffold protein [Actinomycetota bacterium]
MEDSLDKLVESMQSEINWGFSDVTKDHAMNPRNIGTLDHPDGFSVYKGPCGDTMEISIRVEEGIITEAMFWTDGCGSSIASGSMTTVMAKGKTLDDALKIDQLEVLEALQGLPRENVHCALLSSKTLHMAISDFREKEIRESGRSA